MNGFWIRFWTEDLAMDCESHPHFRQVKDAYRAIGRFICVLIHASDRGTAESVLHHRFAGAVVNFIEEKPSAWRPGFDFGDITPILAA